MPDLACFEIGESEENDTSLLGISLYEFGRCKSTLYLSLLGKSMFFSRHSTTSIPLKSDPALFLDRDRDLDEILS